MIKQNKNRTTDFCILGGPKCGTTSLHNYLEQHPDIYVMPKEMHVFGSDINYLEHQYNKTTFDNQILEHSRIRFIGESSVWYGKSIDAVEQLLKYNPDIKLIFMVRNPIDACYSMWSNMYFNGNEPLNFETALMRENETDFTQNLPSFYTCPSLAFTYRKTFKFGEQLERILKIVPEYQLQITFFNDFVQNTEQEFSKVLRFLEASDFKPELENKNPNRSVKSKSFRDFIKQPKGASKSIVKALIPHKPTRERLKSRMLDANSKVEKRQEMSLITRAELFEYYMNDIKLLESITKRDLSSWK